MEPEIRLAEIRLATEYVTRKLNHREDRRDAILDILCGLLLFGFGVFSGIALMGGG